MRNALILTLVAAAGALAGCGRMDLPAQFVEVQRAHRGPYDMRAVSPDGVVLAVRTEDNTDEGDAAFWSKAIRNKLVEDKGYRLVDEKTVTTRGRTPGVMLTFEAERSGVPHRYYTAVYTKGWKVLVGEAGGRAEDIGPLEHEIVHALQTVR
jgi:hypothetical protein